MKIKNKYTCITQKPIKKLKKKNYLIIRILIGTSYVVRRNKK